MYQVTIALDGNESKFTGKMTVDADVSLRELECQQSAESCLTKLAAIHQVSAAQVSKYVSANLAGEMTRPEPVAEPNA